ncbi:hypothetical protein GCM10011499_04730 [Pelagibacterium lentulum]|uniref:Transglycosylase SLT domain-containing protein n=1 Tax=Pelagibacterium lentulum TaxID=2029865 RepID=A0A916VUT6_9HYPH|nr:hypothetical protein GCM10011499_04730 [Pelagibacterium lentulum]
MIAKRLMAIFAAIVLGMSAPVAKAGDERAYIELLIQYYAQYYDVPVELVRRVVQRESTFNPRARNGPYWGLMQILPATARTMGFTGKPEDLLDPETNLIYAVKYLRGAYLVAGGNHDRAVRHYAAGYYYHARDKGLLEETGLRPGPRTPVAPTPPTQGGASMVAVASPPPPPPPLPVGEQFTAPVVASVAHAPQPEPEIPAQAEPVVVAALGFLPPQRPQNLNAPEANHSGLAAIARAAEPAPEAEPVLSAMAVEEFNQAPDLIGELGFGLEMASAYFAAPQTGLARIEGDIFEATFSMLDGLDAVIARSALAAGDDGFVPPARPENL